MQGKVLWLFFVPLFALKASALVNMEHLSTGIKKRDFLRLLEEFSPPPDRSGDASSPKSFEGLGSERTLLGHLVLPFLSAKARRRSLLDLRRQIEEGGVEAYLAEGDSEIEQLLSAMRENSPKDGSQMEADTRYHRNNRFSCHALSAICFGCDIAALFVLPVSACAKVITIAGVHAFVGVDEILMARMANLVQALALYFEQIEHNARNFLTKPVYFAYPDPTSKNYVHLFYGSSPAGVPQFAAVFLKGNAR
jgi:hypothetical protein